MASLTTGITYEKSHSEGLILMDGVNWTSSDGNVVRISGDGTTEAVTCGQAVISAQVPAAGLGAQAGFTVDHVRTVMPAVEATCTETGLTEGLCCANCGEVFEPQQIIDKLPHNYSNWAVTLEPSCTKAGKKEKVCGMCGGKLEEVIPATGHSLVNDEIAEGQHDLRLIYLPATPRKDPNRFTAPSVTQSGRTP